MLKLRILLARCWRRRQCSRATARPQRPAVEEDRPLGCGWFDSSHELVRGLLVREAGAEDLVSMPLGDWLEFELALWNEAATLA